MLLQVMSAPTDISMQAALGTDSSAGTGVTGIHEIQSTVSTGLGVISTIVLMVVGFKLVSKMFRRAGAGGGGGGSRASDDRDLSFVNRYGERMTPDKDGIGWRSSDGRYFGSSGAQDARPLGGGLVSPTRPYRDS